MSTLDNPNTMESSSPNQIIIRYGLIGGLIMVIYGLLGMITGFSSPAKGFVAIGINALFAIAFYPILMVLAVKKHRDELLGGFITFGQAFKTAFFTAAIAAAVGTLFNLLYVNLINPGIVEQMVNDSMVLYEKMGLDEAMIERSVDQVRKGFTPVRQLLAFVIGAVLGLIPTLIVASVMKKDPPEMAV